MRTKDGAETNMDWAYLGIRKSDGSVRAMVFDMPGYERDTAQIVHDWIVEGRAVERVPASEVHARMANPDPDMTGEPTP